MKSQDVKLNIAITGILLGVTAVCGVASVIKKAKKIFRATFPRVAQ